MWRKLLDWLRQLVSFDEAPGHPGIHPHPPMGTDRGEREQIERKMELDSMHAGFRR